MLSSYVPKNFWGEVVLIATYLINRMPSRVLSFQTLCKVFLKSYLRTQLISSIPPKVFDCSAFVHIPQQHWSKLDSKGTKCIFLGYSPNHKGYKCYFPITKRFYTSIDVTYYENQSYYSKIDIEGENRIQEYQFWETKTMIKPQTLESIIVYNYNPISPAPSLSLQMIESVDTEPSTPLGPNQSQTVNSNEFIVYSRKKKKC